MGGYLVERWVCGRASQIGCPGLSMTLFFYFKIGLDTGRIFAKCLIFYEFFHRLSKSIHASQFTCLKVVIGDSNWFTEGFFEKQMV